MALKRGQYGYGGSSWHWCWLKWESTTKNKKTKHQLSMTYCCLFILPDPDAWQHMKMPMDLQVYMPQSLKCSGSEIIHRIVGGIFCFWDFKPNFLDLYFFFGFAWMGIITPAIQQQQQRQLKYAFVTQPSVEGLLSTIGCHALNRSNLHLLHFLFPPKKKENNAHYQLTKIQRAFHNKAGSRRAGEALRKHVFVLHLFVVVCSKPIDNTVWADGSNNKNNQNSHSNKLWHMNSATYHQQQ